MKETIPQRVTLIPEGAPSQPVSQETAVVSEGISSEPTEPRNVFDESPDLSRLGPEAREKVVHSLLLSDLSSRLTAFAGRRAGSIVPADGSRVRLFFIDTGSERLEDAMGVVYFGGVDLQRDSSETTLRLVLQGQTEEITAPAGDSRIDEATGRFLQKLERRFREMEPSLPKLPDPLTFALYGADPYEGEAKKRASRILSQIVETTGGLEAWADAGGLRLPRRPAEASNLAAERQAQAQAELLAYLDNGDIKNLIPLLIDEGKVMDLVEALPHLEELLRAAGYQGKALLVPVGFLSDKSFVAQPAKPSAEPVLIYVHPDAPRASLIRKNLEGVEGFRVVDDLESAKVVIGGAGIGIYPGKAVIRVNEKTAHLVTKALFFRPETSHLLQPGRVLVLRTIYAGQLGEDVLIFA